MPDDLTQLPAGGTFTLEHDTRVDGQDLDRFVDVGGTIVINGYKLFIDGPAKIGPATFRFEKTPRRQPLRAKFPGSSDQAIAELEAAGYVLTKQWTWIAPIGQMPNEREWEAICYLSEEWDFGGIDPTAVSLTPPKRPTILGPSLAVPPGTAITGAYPDGNGGSGVGVVRVPAAEGGGSMPLKAGSVVYRVVEIDPWPEEGPHTWKASASTVERASDRQIKLKRPLPGRGGTLFKPSELGRLFFETPLQAIQHFLAARRLEIESLDRRRKEAERAVTWATGQEGMK